VIKDQAIISTALGRCSPAYLGEYLIWKCVVGSHGNRVAHRTKIHRPTFMILYSAYKINNDLGM